MLCRRNVHVTCCAVGRVAKWAPLRRRLATHYHVAAVPGGVGGARGRRCLCPSCHEVPRRGATLARAALHCAGAFGSRFPPNPAPGGPGALGRPPCTPCAYASRNSQSERKWGGGVGGGSGGGGGEHGDASKLLRAHAPPLAEAMPVVPAQTLGTPRRGSRPASVMHKSKVSCVTTKSTNYLDATAITWPSWI